MLVFYRNTLVWSTRPKLQLVRGIILAFTTLCFFYSISIKSPAWKSFDASFEQTKSQSLEFIPDFDLLVVIFKSENFSPFTSHRWEDSYPENGLILKGAKADLLSDPPNPSDRGDRWNMDHVWFNEQESNLWIPTVSYTHLTLPTKA